MNKKKSILRKEYTGWLNKKCLTLRVFNIFKSTISLFIWNWFRMGRDIFSLKLSV